MFKNTEEYNLILKELERGNVINETFYFKCYSDNIFTYGCKKNNIYHEISFAADDILLYDMDVIDLLDLKRISFFGHSIFLFNNEEDNQIIKRIDWSALDNLSIN